MKEKKIVTIGGGTGMSTMLRGLKKYTENITAVVAVTDDGGGSGRLREDLGILPPGDIRNCLLALADAEPSMEALFSHRFEKGSLSGQSVGNLIIAAMNEMYGDMETAIGRLGEVLAISGRVLPVTTENVHLAATLSDGAVVWGESRIGYARRAYDSPIRKVSLVPHGAAATDAVLSAIEEADAIILGPGSLYTSVIPNLLVDGICEALQKTSAPKIYICNVMGQPGETEGYTAFQHVEAILNHGGCVEYAVLNTAAIPNEITEKYKEEGVGPVFLDEARFRACGIGLIKAPLLDKEHGLARHSPDRLADCLSKAILAIENGIAF